MPFPVIKLGSILIRQISKPIVNSIKRQAIRSPFFRNNVCMPSAQFYHWLDTRLKMRLMGFGTAKEVKPLNEELAIQLGAEMLGEFIVFSVAAGTLYFEYWRQNKNAQEKEDIQNDSLEELNRKMTDVALQLERQDAQIREIMRHLSMNQPSLTERISSLVTGNKSTEASKS